MNPNFPDGFLEIGLPAFLAKLPAAYPTIPNITLFSRQMTVSATD
jgi:hypothetical protein